MKIQNLLKSGIIAGLIVATINIILYYIAKSMGIVNDEIILPNGSPLQLLPVVISSILPGIVAALVLWGISKISKSLKPQLVDLFRFLWMKRLTKKNLKNM